MQLPFALTFGNTMTPLLGIRVVDFSHVIAGPFATFYLAQLGAEVTKVEGPGRSDMMRAATAPPLQGSQRSMRTGESAFESLNSGKSFAQIDITTPAGRRTALEMAASADVFVDNYRPGILDRHGLGYEEVRAINSRIIYCAISGYGQFSPGVAQRGAYDHVIQGLTGMAMLAGADGDPPVKVGFPAVDTTTGILAAFAIVSALRERDRTDRGCMLDISMWGAALQLMYPLVCDSLNNGTRPERLGNQGYSGSPAADIFQCRDGWIAVGANTQTQLVKLAGALEIAPALLDGLLDMKAREVNGLVQTVNAKRLKQLLSDAMVGESAAELEERLNQAGVPAARVRSMHEFVEEYRHRGLLQPLELGAGPTLTPGLGWKVIQESEVAPTFEHPGRHG